MLLREVAARLSGPTATAVAVVVVSGQGWARVS